MNIREPIPAQQTALLGAIKNEMDDLCREAFSVQMTTRLYGPVPDGGWAPPVYTRRQRVRRWLRYAIHSTRERIALWFAPWLAERDD